MYEELVKLLKYAAQIETINHPTRNELMRKAADAIEDLENRLNLWRQDKIRRWIPVTERLPEDIDDVLVTDGSCCAVGYYRDDAQAWDSCEFGWLENRPEPPIGIGTVTHWMPLPELPKEDYKCESCAYDPPSSCDGKPCTQCDTTNDLTNCYVPKDGAE